ncbi:hypothetical protein MP228_001230 [Amoeboaphelidium protococcarum]|nr:hypothetical protein MP228_001230 [Amoeboaphelidium protococcarum]
MIIIYWLLLSYLVVSDQLSDRISQFYSRYYGISDFRYSPNDNGVVAVDLLVTVAHLSSRDLGFSADARQNLLQQLFSGDIMVKTTQSCTRVYNLMAPVVQQRKPDDVNWVAGYGSGLGDCIRSINHRKTIAKIFAFLLDRIDEITPRLQNVLVSYQDDLNDISRLFTIIPINLQHEYMRKVVLQIMGVSNWPCIELKAALGSGDETSHGLMFKLVALNIQSLDYFMYAKQGSEVYLTMKPDVGELFGFGVLGFKRALVLSANLMDSVLMIPEFRASSRQPQDNIKSPNEQIKSYHVSGTVSLDEPLHQNPSIKFIFNPALDSRQMYGLLFKDQLAHEWERMQRIKRLAGNGFEFGKITIEWTQSGDNIDYVVMYPRVFRVTPVSDCFNCGQETSRTCSRCLKFYYCSKRCMNEDWQNHKKYCKKMIDPQNCAMKNRVKIRFSDERQTQQFYLDE